MMEAAETSPEDPVAMGSLSRQRAVAASGGYNAGQESCAPSPSSPSRDWDAKLKSAQESKGRRLRGAEVVALYHSHERKNAEAQRALAIQQLSKPGEAPVAESVWQEAAGWCAETRMSRSKVAAFFAELGFSSLVHPQPSSLGYPDAPGLQMQLGVDSHEENAGFTWYIVQCYLSTADASHSWQAPRRLCQLRGLHDLVKERLNHLAYTESFGDAPFARHTAPQGTTARVTAWLAQLAGLVTRKALEPELVALILRFFQAGTILSAASGESKGSTM